MGPASGTDAAIIKIGAGRVMAVTTDPLSLIPTLGAEHSARLSCHLVASDLWTTGIPPAFASVSLQLPPDFGDDELALYWRALSAEMEKLGIAVVTGHTGRYEGCGLPILGAATVFGMGDEGRTVGPAFVKPGDRVLVTRDCAVEATAITARIFPQKLARLLEPEGMEDAAAMISNVTVVPECRAALRVGVRDRGVSSLHDATEGGVLGGLLEVARATKLDLRIEQGRIPLSAAARAACELLGIDPYWTLSEGTLIVTARREAAEAVRQAIAEEGTRVEDVGEVVAGNGMVWLTSTDGQVAKLREPRPDPWWDAYARGLREGWS